MRGIVHTKKVNFTFSFFVYTGFLQSRAGFLDVLYCIVLYCIVLYCIVLYLFQLCQGMEDLVTKHDRDLFSFFEIPFITVVNYPFVYKLLF